MRTSWIGLGLTALALAGCGNTGQVARPASLRVTMVDTAASTSPMGALARPGGDLADVEKVIVNLARIEVVSSAGAVVEVPIANALTDTDGDGHKDVDLMAISGSAAVIVDGTLPAGTYSQFRLFSPLETGSDASGVYMVRAGQEVPLRVPSGQQTGLKLVVEAGLELRVGATTSLTLDFDLARSLVATGNGRYLLKPVVRASGQVTSGVVTGRVTLPGGSTGVAATVEAEAGATLVTGTAGPDGRYELPVVPAPATYEFRFSWENEAGVVYRDTLAGVEVEANASQSVDATFEPTGAAAGLLRYGTSLLPAAGATVEALLDAELVATVEAGADGRFLLPTLAPGTYELRFSLTVGTTVYRATLAEVTVRDGLVATANGTLE